MPTTSFGRTQLTVSRMGLGGNRLGGLPGTRHRRSSAAVIEQALAEGITFFDTADAYGAGTSEAVLGDVLAGVPDAIVATKVGYRFEDRSTVGGLARTALHTAARTVKRRGGDAAYRTQDFTPGAIEAAVDGSCRRLHRERLDVLQLHGPPRAASTGLPEVIDRLRRNGRIGAFGVGCETVDVAASWLDVDGLDCIQLPFGVLDPQADDEGVLAEARRRGIGVVVRGALGGGVLGRHLRGEPTGLDALRAERVRRLDELAEQCDVELGQLAVWFARRGATADVVLLGATNAKQLGDCLRWAKADLPDPAIARQLDAIVHAGNPA